MLAEWRECVLILTSHSKLSRFTPSVSAFNLKCLWDACVKEFESYLVPIPPLAEQARIVAILDKFDALTHSISEGLPREIELRQKQYAHYRDLLLSFPKPEVAA